MTSRGIARRRPARWLPAVLALSLTVAPAAVADEVEQAREALVAGGHVALIRHGNAPGPSLGRGGDPSGFRIDDCRTQRNLDALGRDQARALGEAFRRHGVPVGRILSSPWCRCVDTGRLMAVGEVETSWALVPDVGSSVPRLTRLQEIVSGWGGPGTLVLVTHALTVRPLAGILPAQAETVVLKPAPRDPRGGTVVGRIAPPDAAP